VLWAAAAPPPFAPVRVEAVLRGSGLKVLPDIATKLPAGELMDYGFLGRNGAYVQAIVVVYPTALKARQMSVAYEGGSVRGGLMSRPTKTERVRNVVLLRGRLTTNAQWLALRVALGRLGRLMSP
jgi:hypothetical protein